MSSNQGYEDLIQKLANRNLTATNPDLREVVTFTLEDWVNAYNSNPGRIDRNNEWYVRGGEIPHVIPYQTNFLTPKEIYEHVKSEDKLGLSLIESILSGFQEEPFLSSDEEVIRDYFKEELMDEIWGKEHEVDEITGLVIEKPITYQDVALSLIDLDLSTRVVTNNIKIGIVNLYESNRNPFYLSNKRLES